MPPVGIFSSVGLLVGNGLPPQVSSSRAVSAPLERSAVAMMRKPRQPHGSGSQCHNKASFEIV